MGPPPASTFPGLPVVSSCESLAQRALRARRVRHLDVRRRIRIRLHVLVQRAHATLLEQAHAPVVSRKAQPLLPVPALPVDGGLTIKNA